MAIRLTLQLIIIGCSQLLLNLQVAALTSNLVMVQTNRVDSCLSVQKRESTLLSVNKDIMEMLAWSL